MDMIAWNNYYGFGLSMPKVAVVLSPGMPHTYAYMRVNKACRDSYDEYVNEINKI